VAFWPIATMTVSSSKNILTFLNILTLGLGVNAILWNCGEKIFMHPG
jgi:hypothetical protein